jgi:uncharacterized protein YheU (UPF0270 family)
MIEEFVTRDWSSLADDGYSLEVKVEQVLEQLKVGKLRVVLQSHSILVIKKFKQTVISYFQGYNRISWKEV